MTVDDLLAPLPALRADYRVFMHRLDNALDPVLLDLCRRRVAQLHGVGPATPVVAGTTPRECACIDVAEQFVLDVHGVSDAMMAAVTAHLSPREAVALLEAVAMADGLTRLQLVMGADG